MKDMKEILKRCQALQTEVLNMRERSFDVKTMNFYPEGASIGLVSVRATLFYDIGVEKEWVFIDCFSEEENNAVATEMEEYIKNLKK